MSKSIKNSESNNIKKTGEKVIVKKTTKGKTTKQIMQKHIQDVNDVITEEDFKNLELNLDTPSTETSHTPDIADNEDRPKDEDKDPKIVTPWDVIN